MIMSIITGLFALVIIFTAVLLANLVSMWMLTRLRDEEDEEDYYLEEEN